MNYKLVLNYKTREWKKVLDIIQPQTGKMDRSEIAIKHDKEKIEFRLKAKDATALKASINSIIKGFTVYEKTLRMVEND